MPSPLVRRVRTAVLIAAILVAQVALYGSLASGASSVRVYLPLVPKVYPPYPSAPWLAPIDNADGDGNYLVYWSPSDRADSYELQEKWADGDWFAAYRGFTRQVELRNRPAGTYQYRVRSENSWGPSAWSDLRSVTVPGNPPGTISTPGSSSVNADGQAVVKVINDCPYYLRVDLTGPEPRLMEVLKCDICSVYSFIGPFFCPTSGRPIDENRVDPGPYRVYVSVSDPSIKPWVGHWQLNADRRYTVCFFVVRSWAAGAQQPSAELVASACP